MLGHYSNRPFEINMETASVQLHMQILVLAEAELYMTFTKFGTDSFSIIVNIIYNLEMLISDFEFPAPRDRFEYTRSDHRVVLYGESDSWNLATCGKTRDRLLFSSYVAFEPTFWYIFILATILLPSVMFILYYLKVPQSERRGHHWNFIYNITAMTVGRIIGSSPDPSPQIQQSPSLLRVFLILFSVWNFIAVFVTICYGNLFAVEFIAPLCPVRAHILKFKDAKSFRFYSDNSLGYLINIHEDVVNATRHSEPHMFGCPAKFDCLDIDQIQEEFGLRSLDLTKWQVVTSLRKNQSSVFNTFLLKGVLPEVLYSAAYEEISKNCFHYGLIHTNEVLDAFLENTKLKNKYIVFNKVNERLLKTKNCLHFSRWNIEYFYSRMQLITQSGIHHIWQK
jgi:hypothetical protein